jgi:hypothetical protein
MCGCGGTRQVVTHEQAQAKKSGQAPQYTVTAPDGTYKTFTRYIEAVTHKRTVNGKLSTST